MERRKCIAVFIADLQSEYHHRTMEGIIRQASALGYHVAAYSFFSNREANIPVQTGEENIFSLFSPDQVDGIIVQKASFTKQSVQERIAELCQTSGLPYVEVDECYHDPDFPMRDERELFAQLVTHMIEEHGAKKIACLTGQRGISHSEERLAGYRDAMEAHGLTCDRNMIFYGDFWKESAVHVAEGIASGSIEKPDAVVCANGVMAVSLTNALIENGIRVPEDVAVAGYDSFYENVLSIPSVTALSDVNFHMGLVSMCRLHREMTGEICQKIEEHVEQIQTGDSCGCRPATTGLFRVYQKEITEQLFYLELFQSCSMMQEISAVDNLSDFSDTVHRFIYLIRGLKVLHLCICDDWDGINNTSGESYRVEGYSDKMLLFRHVRDIDATHYRMVDQEDLHNAIQTNPSPSAYFYVPLHYEDRCFGCIAIELQPGTYAFDRQFWTWSKYISTALETLRIRNYIRRFSERSHLTVIRDPMTGLYNRRGFEELSAEMFEQAMLYKEKFLLLAVDIYQFREINQKYGYTCGDSVLMTLADALSQSCRGNEICCRCGDDNFYIIGSFDYDADSVKWHVDNIRQYFAKHLEETVSGVRIELDIGCICEEITEEMTLSDLLQRVQESIEKQRMEDTKRVTYLKSLLELRQKIYNAPQEKWTVDRMANNMMLSRAYFQRLYKKHFGVSAMADVITARMALAKQLLVGERRSIAEIATACGYDSEIYFMQQFKKETGMTPTQYRKRQMKPDI